MSEQQLTKEQIEEIKSKLDNQIWRLDNLYYITDVSGKKIKFKMNKVQMFLYKNKWFRNIIPKSRQHGITTFISVFFLDSVLFGSNQKAIILAHTQADSRKIFESKVKFAYDNLPQWLKTQFKVNTDNQNILRFDTNGSSIEVATSARSGTYQYIHISEFGVLCARYPEKAKEIVTGTLNTAHVGQSIIFIESTAKGKYGYFYDFCMEAMANQKMGKLLTELDWKFFFFGWTENELNRLNGDVVITAEMQEYFDSLKEKEGIELTKEQKNFYVKTKETQRDDMWSEFPSCVEENVLVSTLNGLVKIRDVEVDGKYVLAKYDKGDKEVYRVKTSFGYELECTSDHPILTDNGYRKLEELKVGDFVYLGKNQFGKNIEKVVYYPNEFVKSEIIIDEDFARFIGYFMGDGSFYMNRTKSGTISICCDVQDVKTIEDVKLLMDKYLGGWQERKVGIKLGGLELRKASTKWLDAFLAMGIIERKDDNRYKRRIYVPDFIKRSPEDVVKNFLSGLWESDGFVSREGNHGGFFSKDEKFIKDVQLLLLSFGITSKLSIANKINGEGRVYVGRKLSLRKDEIIKFQKEIGFISDRKVSRINVTKSRVTYNQRSIEFKDRISKIENIGYKRVFDITTSTKNFIANGIIVHNCPEEAFKASIEGAYYTKQLNRMYGEKRVTHVPHDASIPVYTFFDLGVGDSTSIGFVQFAGLQIRLIDEYEASGEGLQHYARILQEKAAQSNYVYEGHYAPHDIEVRELGSNAKTRREIARGLGLHFKVVKKHSVDVGIDKTRSMLNLVWIDESKCSRTLSALQGYRKEFDEKLGTWGSKPLHSWESHFADMIRQLAMTYESITGNVATGRSGKKIDDEDEPVEDKFNRNAVVGGNF